MPWERGYYYRARKVSGRVVRQYLGAGDFAQLAYHSDALERQSREEAAAAVRREKAALAALDAKARESLEATRAVARAALMAAGYHQHKRSEWRKKRGANDVSETTLPAGKPSGKPVTRDEFIALTTRLLKGDASAVPAFREALRAGADPDMLLGAADRLALQSLLEKFASKNLLLRETTEHRLAQLRAELSGPNPSAVERLLVETVLVCWLHVHHLETSYGLKTQMSLQLGLYYERCLTMAQKRYLAALKTLATVRRLPVPVLQVNVARQQVNVAGPARAPVGVVADDDTLIE